MTNRKRPRVGAMMDDRALPEGERRFAPVSEDDPDRKKLVAIVALKTTDRVAWRRACESYVEENLSLALSYATGLNARHVPLDDLYHAAVEGLRKAIENFDPTKAGKFSTYAVWKMRHECGQLLHRDETLVAPPSRLRDDKRAVERAAVAKPQAEDEEILETLRREEREAEERGEELPKGRKRWARSTVARVREARETYLGHSHAGLDPRTASDTPDPSAGLDVRRAVRALPEPYRSVLAASYDLWEPNAVVLSDLPEGSLARKIAEDVGLRRLRRALGS